MGVGDTIAEFVSCQPERERPAELSDTQERFGIPRRQAREGLLRDQQDHPPNRSLPAPSRVWHPRTRHILRTNLKTSWDFPMGAFRLYRSKVG